MRTSIALAMARQRAVPSALAGPQLLARVGRAREEALRWTEEAKQQQAVLPIHTDGGVHPSGYSLLDVVVSTASNQPDKVPMPALRIGARAAQTNVRAATSGKTRLLLAARMLDNVLVVRRSEDERLAMLLAGKDPDAPENSELTVIDSRRLAADPEDKRKDGKRKIIKRDRERTAAEENDTLLLSSSQPQSHSSSSPLASSSTSSSSSRPQSSSQGPSTAPFDASDADRSRIILENLVVAIDFAPQHATSVAQLFQNARRMGLRSIVVSGGVENTDQIAAIAEASAAVCDTLPAIPKQSSVESVHSDSSSPSASSSSATPASSTSSPQPLKIKLHRNLLSPLRRLQSDGFVIVAVRSFSAGDVSPASRTHLSTSDKASSRSLPRKAVVVFCDSRLTFPAEWKVVEIDPQAGASIESVLEIASLQNLI